jgi:hypothetical protein
MEAKCPAVSELRPNAKSEVENCSASAAIAADRQRRFSLLYKVPREIRSVRAAADRLP